MSSHRLLQKETHHSALLCLAQVFPLVGSPFNTGWNGQKASFELLTDELLTDESLGPRNLSVLLF